jgi:hypothetical protein
MASPLVQPLTRDELDGPNRCQAVTHRGQCSNRVVEGKSFCVIHNIGCGAERKEERTRMQNYVIQQWQQELDHFSTNPKLKSLGEEIAILRVLMNNVLLRCHDTTDLILQSSKISDLASRIEKLVVSCDKLDQKLNLTLDKATALSLAQQIVTIITTHVQDSETIDKIGHDIVEVINNLTGPR